MTTIELRDPPASQKGLLEEALSEWQNTIDHKEPSATSFTCLATPGDVL